MRAVVTGGGTTAAGGGQAKHRARKSPHRGHWLPVLAVVVVLLVTAFATWRLVADVGEPATDPATDPPTDPALDAADAADAAAGGGAEGPTDDQRHVTRTRIQDEEELRVLERLTFAEPMTYVVISNPARPGLGTGFAPAVDRGWMDVGTGRLDIEDLPSVGGTLRLELPSPATQVTIGYLVSGVVVPSPDSAPGRALSLTTPLRIESGAGERRVDVHGSWVDNLGCVPDSGQVVACGARTPLGWSVSGPAGDLVDVVAQLTITGS